MDLRTDRVTVSVGELGGLCEVRGESILDVLASRFQYLLIG